MSDFLGGKEFDPNYCFVFDNLIISINKPSILYARVTGDKILAKMKEFFKILFREDGVSKNIYCNNSIICYKIIIYIFDKNSFSIMTIRPFSGICSLYEDMTKLRINVKRPMEKPFRLDEGIYFEDTMQILAWGESIEELKKIDNPEISKNGDFLKWYGKSCFGGQKLNVTVYKNQYKNKRGIFKLINFEEVQESQLTIHKTAEKYSAVFVKYFGKPCQTSTHNGRTTELWNINGLQIILGVGENFAEFLIFGMHYGEKFYELQEY